MARQAIDIATTTLAGWQMAGYGAFRVVDGECFESEGGPGLLWYTPREFGDLMLSIDWSILSLHDNSGVFLRFPALGRDYPAHDWKVAVEHGYEIQIDDRGYNPSTGQEGDPLHSTGAIYGLAPARCVASNPLGLWTHFEIQARGSSLSVMLNGTLVSELTEDRGRPRRGHIGLQNHHDGSRVQFRRLRVEAWD